MSTPSSVYRSELLWGDALVKPLRAYHDFATKAQDEAKDSCWKTAAVAIVRFITGLLMYTLGGLSAFFGMIAKHLHKIDIVSDNENTIHDFEGLFNGTDQSREVTDKNWENLTTINFTASDVTTKKEEAITAMRAFNNLFKRCDFEFTKPVLPVQPAQPPGGSGKGSAAVAVPTASVTVNAQGVIRVFSYTEIK